MTHIFNTATNLAYIQWLTRTASKAKSDIYEWLVLNANNTLSVSANNEWIQHDKNSMQLGNSNTFTNSGQLLLPSVLWRCWLGSMKGIRPVKKRSDGVLAWLSVCGKVQICVWPSRSHCHSLFLSSVKSRMVLVLAHMGSPGKSPEVQKTDICVCVSKKFYYKLADTNDKPIAASFVSWLCVAEHSFSAESSSSRLGREDVGWWNSRHAFAVAVVADRIVSVRPCLNAAVLQDSYVGAVFPPDSL